MTGRLLLLVTLAAAVLGIGYGAYEHFGERARHGGQRTAAPPLVESPVERPTPLVPHDKVEAPAVPSDQARAAPPGLEAAPGPEAAPGHEDAAEAALVPPRAADEPGPPTGPALPEAGVAPAVEEEQEEQIAAPVPAAPGRRPEEAPPAEASEPAPPVAAPVPPAGGPPVATRPEPLPPAASPAPRASAERSAAADPVPEARARAERVEPPATSPDDDPAAVLPEGEVPEPAVDAPSDPLSRGVDRIRRALAALLSAEDGDETEPAREDETPPSPAPAAPPVASDPAPAAEDEVASGAAEPELPAVISRSVATIRRALAAIVAGGEGPEPGAGPPAGEAEVALAPPEAEPRVVEEEVRPSFDIVRVAPDGRSVIAGRAAPGAEVEVRAGEQVIDAITADRRGHWIATPPEPLAPGHLELTLLARAPGGSQLLSSEVVVVVVPGPPPPQPPPVAASEPPPPQPAEVAAGEAPQPEPPEAVGGPPGDLTTAALAPADPLALLLPREGGRGRVLQAPGKISAGGELALMVLDYDEAGQVRLTGEAPPGAPVRVYVDNELAGEVVAGAGGEWSLVLTRELEPGEYTLRLDQIDPSGRPVARLETPFSRVGQPPVAGEAQVDYVIVQPGNSLWRISRRLFGQGMLYTQIYDANQGQIRDPDLIYPGQVFEIPKGLGEAG